MRVRIEDRAEQQFPLSCGQITSDYIENLSQPRADLCLFMQQHYQSDESDLLAMLKRIYRVPDDVVASVLDHCDENMQVGDDLLISHLVAMKLLSGMCRAAMTVTTELANVTAATKPRPIKRAIL